AHAAGLGVALQEAELRDIRLDEAEHVGPGPLVDRCGAGVQGDQAPRALAGTIAAAGRECGRSPGHDHTPVSLVFLVLNVPVPMYCGMGSGIGPAAVGFWAGVCTMNRAVKLLPTSSTGLAPLRVFRAV